MSAALLACAPLAPTTRLWLIVSVTVMPPRVIDRSNDSVWVSLRPVAGDGPKDHIWTLVSALVCTPSVRSAVQVKGHAPAFVDGLPSKRTSKLVPLPAK